MPLVGTAKTVHIDRYHDQCIEQDPSKKRPSRCSARRTNAVLALSSAHAFNVPPATSRYVPDDLHVDQCDLRLQLSFADSNHRQQVVAAVPDSCAHAVPRCDVVTQLCSCPRMFGCALRNPLDRQLVGMLAGDTQCSQRKGSHTRVFIRTTARTVTVLVKFDLLFRDRRRVLNGIWCRRPPPLVFRHRPCSEFELL
jgi:hypothetical protein